MRAELLSNTTRARAAKYAPLLVFCLLLTVYHLVFGQFFPNRNGTVGHDYSLAIPGSARRLLLVSGQRNLGGSVVYPGILRGTTILRRSPVRLLLSIAVVDPHGSALERVPDDALVCGARLLGRVTSCCAVFRGGQESAILAATIFMFNGFFAHRMIVGHLGYHGFMLIPWMALSSCRALAGGRDPMAAIRAPQDAWRAWWVPTGCNRGLVP